MSTSTQVLSAAPIHPRTPCVARLVLRLALSASLMFVSACTSEPPPTPKPTLAQLTAAYEAARARSDWAAMLEVGREMDRRFAGSPEEKRFNSERAEIAAKAVDVSLAGVEVKPDPPPAPSKLKTLDANGLRQMLFACKHEVDAEIKRANDTPFGWTQLDEYAADSFQAAAPNLFDSDDERIASLKSQIKNSDAEWALLSFPVLEIEDSFSGPQRTVKPYRCSIARDLSISVSR